MKALPTMMLAAAALLAGCGGGGDGGKAPPPATSPAITGFSADAPVVMMGDGAHLLPAFAGGTGRIEPGIGPVVSGVPVATPALEADALYRLIVEAANQPAAVRVLALPVRHRDRFVEAGAFRSAHHAALELPDGGVLVIGGSRGDSVLSNAVDRFDPATRTFQRVATMATGRANTRPVLLADGRVLIVGGLTAVASGVVLELFDPTTGQVTRAGTPVRNRTGHTATRLADGRVLIAGGVEDDTAELWDPVTRSARLLGARMAHSREGHTATLLPDGRVLLVGGYSLAGVYWLAELFDPVTERFTVVGDPRLAPQNENLALHSAHLLADRTVLIVGGDRFIPGVDTNDRPTAAVLRFDPATGGFTPQPGLLAPRSWLAAMAFPDDRVLLFGGMGVDGAVPTGEVYRGAEGGAPTAGLGAARAYHTVSRLPGGRVLIVGGEAPGGILVPGVLIYE